MNPEITWHFVKPFVKFEEIGPGKLVHHFSRYMILYGNKCNSLSTQHIKHTVALSAACCCHCIVLLPVYENYIFVSPIRFPRLLENFETAAAQTWNKHMSCVKLMSTRGPKKSKKVTKLSIFLFIQCSPYLRGGKPQKDKNLLLL